MTISTDRGGPAATGSGALPSAAGLRGVNPGALCARKAAQRYRQADAPCPSRTDVRRAAKDAAPHMGIKGTRLALIDLLFSTSLPQDWTGAGTAPVVWPSNAHLARKLGVGISTVGYHLAGLARLGLIAHTDSATCRRRGRRDRQGRIIEACGIDLSPMAMRHDELVAIAETAALEAAERKRLSYRRTVLDKEIRSLLSDAGRRELPGPWHHAMARREVLAAERPRDIDALAELIEALEAMLDELQDVYAEATNTTDAMLHIPNFEDRGPENSAAPYITTAPTGKSGICSQNGIALKRRASPAFKGDTCSVKAAYGSWAFEKKPDANTPENKQSSVETDNQNANQPDQSPVEQSARADVGYAATGDRFNDDDVLQLSIGLLRDACPDIEGPAPGALADWQALRASGPALCAGTDINPQVFSEASQYLGPDIAIAAIAVTVQKAAMGTVMNPGAYLRTLTKRGRKGELRIARSLHGLAEKNGRYHRADPNGQEPGSRPDAFPETGSIAYSHWADIVRQNAPEPTPDVDIVADAFRSFCRRNDIDTTSPNIERVFTTFARKWKERPWDTNG